MPETNKIGAFERFHNTLRILTSIDMHELEAAGVIGECDTEAWRRFRDDPFRWFIRADALRARAVWDIIEARQPRAIGQRS